MIKLGKVKVDFLNNRIARTLSTLKTKGDLEKSK